MPSFTEPQGNSEHTPVKQAALRYWYGMHSDVVQKIQKKPYVYPRYACIDLTAGSGDNAGVPGSPIIFAEHAERLGLPIDLWCCEGNPERAAELRRRLQPYVSDTCAVRVLPGDHRDTIAQILKHYEQAARAPRPAVYGVVYFDANGGVLPVEIFQRIARTPTLRYLDFLGHVSATSIKRTAWQHGRDLQGDLEACGKDNVWIATPQTAAQWTFVFLTNWKDMHPLQKPEWGLNLDRSDTEEGRDNLNRLTLPDLGRHTGPPVPGSLPYHTYEEYLHHPKFLAVRDTVMRRARGYCQWCSKERATQVHHLKYPPWGTFDVPENLIAVCRPCHARLHGKDR